MHVKINSISNYQGYPSMIYSCLWALLSHHRQVIANFEPNVCQSIDDILKFCALFDIKGFEKGLTDIKSVAGIMISQGL